MTEQPDPGKKTRRWAWIATGAATILAAAAILLLILHLNDTGSDEASSFQAFPPGGPVEFLYLDAPRVATYLAQVEGGTVESEKLSRKLTQSLKATLAAKEAGGVEATKENELISEKILKPTAASSFFALRQRLEDAGVLHEVRSRYFAEDVKHLQEGTFVEFHTSALLPPIYLNAYLAVLHASTLDAIFPDSEEQRHKATEFFEQVGSSGRAVFAVRPYARVPGSGSDGGASTSTVDPPRKPFVYLMPITASLLSPERSLLKYGGGRFTVLGLMVRRFPEPKPHEPDAYVDSATEETWEQALEHAPGELLCRTAPDCARQVRGQHLSGAARLAEIERARNHIIGVLKQQTTIEKRGAVILPIGIYK